MANLLTLTLIGLSVGLSNFAASIAIGLSGVNRALRFKIGLVFGIFETGMPVIGLLIGHKLAGELGNSSNLIGGGLLIATGLYALIQTYRQDHDAPVDLHKSLHKLLLAGLALSIDNLIVGFSLGTVKVPLAEAVLVMGLTSVVLSLIGLELGSRLKSRVEGFSELLSGIILILVGLAIGLRLL